MPTNDPTRDIAIAACNAFGGNDGRFNLDYFAAAAREEFDLAAPPSREWAETVLRRSDVASTVDGGFSWVLRNVQRIARQPR